MSSSRLERETVNLSNDTKTGLRSLFFIRHDTLTVRDGLIIGTVSELAKERLSWLGKNIFFLVQ